MRDQASLIAALRDHGLTVAIGDPVGQVFLRTAGTALLVSGGRLAQPTGIQVYEYTDPATAAEDSSRLQPNGNAFWTEPSGTGRGAIIDWVSTPHLYRNERLVVIYVGSDPALLDLLASLLPLAVQRSFSAHRSI